MTIDELVDEMRDELDELIGDVKHAISFDEHKASLERYTYLHKWYRKACDVQKALRVGDGNE